ncbi:MAG: tetratricopeptide repeat protein, partial [Proteobacteria bacterium]|nr:tetratricopeptide repeat protein [Pseudomonadota bacterium]
IEGSFMSTSKQAEKILKRPDSFQELGMKLVDYLVNNKSKVALMLSPLLLVALIGYGYFYMQKHQSAKRRTELAKITMMQSKEREAVGTRMEEVQKQIDILKATPSTPASSAKPGAKEPAIDAATLLKIAQLEKSLKDMKPDHGPSAESFKSFYNSNKSNAEGWMAGISWASYTLSQGKLSDVKPILEEIVGASQAHKFYQLQSRYMLAGINEDLGDFDAALKQAEILTGLADDETKPMMLMLKGQILYFKKDLAGARPILNEIIEKHGSTREAQTARSLLAEIGPA